MIYVSKDQLAQVEYLIAQSVRGHHLLFETESLRRVFIPEKGSTPGELSNEEARDVEQHIERLIQQPTLLHKRAYLDGLDARTYRLVVRTYFNIVENNIFEKLEVRH